MVAVKFAFTGISCAVALPAYQTSGAAGLDLQAAIQNAMSVAPREWRLVPTGLRMELPEGYEAQIRPRSGLALKHGVTVLNSPGTIDSDYRGEIAVILINMGGLPFQIKPGDRIAQMVIAPVSRPDIELADLDDTNRGDGGFGSTGS